MAFGYTNASGEFVDFRRRHTVSMAEFFAFLRRQDLITAKLTVAKSVNIFMASSFTEGPDTWEEWKWEMQYDQFLEALCRLALLMASRQRFEILYTHCTPEVRTTLTDPWSRHAAAFQHCVVMVIICTVSFAALRTL